MNQSDQDRYRPLIEKRLRLIGAEINDLGPEALSGLASARLAYRSDEGSVADHPSAQQKLLLDQQLRLQLSLQRIEGGYFGRCIRCGRDLPKARLEAEPDALTCGDCRPRRR